MNKKNPLDYFVRKSMIEEKFSNAICMPILDQDSDDEWSINLDQMLQQYASLGPVVLYGGRDSFLEAYTGTLPGRVIAEIPYISSTAIRESIKPTNSEEFRSGIIYATNRLRNE